ncbi:hypothetical protein C2845_PM02G12020 [Panicum miliaceum]|uniref:F-box protein AT5G49610-like beta-propeller domain-containing protein n=1 Tax=Panicum miliaceum TaxID=4540 RepID=A0A3L6SCJ4_PANMI|nr:hypothetical protein C2845_PM02G12020 [Panicum miliaceum]
MACPWLIAATAAAAADAAHLRRLRGRWKTTTSSQISSSASRPSLQPCPAPPLSAGPGAASSPTPGFLGRFRARHRRPPLLGNEGDCWDLLGVRHGRVLIFNRTRHEFLVWDPATGDRHCVAAPPEFNAKGKFVCNGAVLCAAGEQGHAQHGECHSAPFRLFLIGIGEDERRAFACVYSSQTREWGNPSSTALRCMDDNAISASTLIGDSLYWLLEDIESGILVFDLGTQSIDRIGVPPDMDTNCSNYQIILEEGGGLGIAALRSLSFDVWERKVGNDGVAS